MQERVNPSNDETTNNSYLTAYINITVNNKASPRII